MTLSLSLACPSMGGHEEAVTSWRDTASKPWEVTVYDEREGEAAGFLSKCDRAWRESSADIVGLLHSDLHLLEVGWDERIVAEFQDERVGVVGLVGAVGLGTDDIYRVPYDFRQLARSGVVSNLIDAEVHGGRETGSRDVAVIDSCAVFVRRHLLARLGGWPVGRYPNSSHCSDLWLCASAYRLGSRTRNVGVGCAHKSGGKGEEGCKWLDERGGDDSMHKAAHKLIYDEFRDVLPIRIRA